MTRRVLHVFLAACSYRNLVRVMLFRILSTNLIRIASSLSICTLFQFLHKDLATSANQIITRQSALQHARDFNVIIVSTNPIQSRKLLRFSLFPTDFLVCSPCLHLKSDCMTFTSLSSSSLPRVHHLLLNRFAGLNITQFRLLLLIAIDHGQANCQANWRISHRSRRENPNETTYRGL